jgi:uncharacterized protein
MRYVIPGGSGQVGTVLARALHQAGHEVIVVSRTPTSAPWTTAAWDARTLGDWCRYLDGADVVVNLAGRTVNCRYTQANLEAMMRSRVDSTRVVGEAIAGAANPPRVWLQASTATIYSHRFDAANDDFTGIIGGSEPDAPAYWKFSVDIAQAWEKAQEDAKTPRTRKVALRSAMVMSPDADGIFDTLLTLVRRGLGGRAASGRQYISWVHETDFINAVQWLVERDDVSGPIIIASPNPLPQAEFMRILRRAAGVPIGVPATMWMLKLGAVFMRTDVELIAKSRRVVPARLLAEGFRFQVPKWEDAARDLVARATVSRVPK